MHLFQQFGLNLSTDKKTTLKSLYINRSESGSAFANLYSVEFPAINPFLDGRSRDLMPIHQVFKSEIFRIIYSLYLYFFNQSFPDDRSVSNSLIAGQVI